MAKDDAGKGAPRDPKKEVSPADWLFRDESATKSPKPPPSPAPASNADFSETFELEAETISMGPPKADPASPFAGARSWDEARVPRASKSARVADQPMLDPSELVEEVWTRTAEWAPTLTVVGAWVAVVLTAVYVALWLDLVGLAFLTLFMGALVAAVLCYPILITLERPVRMTPEQAVRDYYGSLAHHFPHFRRMWLLLSSAGRISTAYGSLEGFKAYWKDRLQNLRAGRVGSMTPLVFEVANFQADKSAGKARIDAEYTLKVWIRGQRNAGVLHSISMRVILVRGPDNMWYLENGTLGRDDD